MTDKKTKTRNLAAKSPLMKKGGAHEKSTSAKRQQEKRDFKKSMKDELEG